MHIERYRRRSSAAGAGRENAKANKMLLGFSRGKCLNLRKAHIRKGIKRQNKLHNKYV